MRLITTIREMRDRASELKLIKSTSGGRENQTIGFVPTMGALHEGHLSLIRTAQKENDAVIVSIFVNPIQFCPGEDFQRYPRQLEQDKELLNRVGGVDTVFYPDIKEMYPEGYCTSVDVKNLGNRLCGSSRLGHFSGVATVVTKLFNIVKPDAAYFGQKDFQQTVIIKRLIADLNMDVEIKVLPTVRDEDGLALSSRNQYLSREERQDALCLYQALLKAKSLANSGETDAKKIIKEMVNVVNRTQSSKIDYVSIVNPDTLEDVQEIKDGAVAALAVWIGKTRLIDNIILD
ncbi:MAG TPA: pantoate--beta-alanine ligase [Candidatus Brocadiia bacterium]|nr:pantoate--beta-alanine ligase [Candidatus Brocadiales bacterium]